MIVGMEVLEALGVPGYVMRINNRKILDGLLDEVGAAEREQRHAVLRAVDKLPKIGRDGVAKELAAVAKLDDERGPFRGGDVAKVVNPIKMKQFKD